MPSSTPVFQPLTLRCDFLLTASHSVCGPFLLWLNSPRQRAFSKMQAPCYLCPRKPHATTITQRFPNPREYILAWKCEAIDSSRRDSEQRNGTAWYPSAVSYLCIFAIIRDLLSPRVDLYMHICTRNFGSESTWEPQAYHSGKTPPAPSQEKEKKEPHSMCLRERVWLSGTELRNQNKDQHLVRATDNVRASF